MCAFQHDDASLSAVYFRETLCRELTAVERVDRLDQPKRHDKDHAPSLMNLESI